MTALLVLDERYSDAIAVALRARGHDVVSVVADAGPRGASDADIFRWATAAGRRIVTENIKDFRPLLMNALAADAPFASLSQPVITASTRELINHGVYACA